MPSHATRRFAFVVLQLALAACNLTVGQRDAIVAAEELACALVPVADPDIPKDIEAKACALAEDATKAIPASADAVKTKAKKVAAAPPVQMEHLVPGHGKVIDKRVVVGLHVDGGAK